MPRELYTPYPTAGLATLYGVLRPGGASVVRASDGATVADATAAWPGAAVAVSDAGSPTHYYADAPAAVAPGSYPAEYYLRAGVAPVLGADRLVGVGTVAVGYATPPAPPPGSPLYATADDFPARWGVALATELSQLSPGVTTPDADRITLALLDADKRITLGLARRYVVPVAVGGLTPDARQELRDLATTAAMAWLYRSRFGRELDADGRPVDPSGGYDADFRRRVALLAAGVVPLPGAVPLQRRPTMEVAREGVRRA